MSGAQDNNQTASTSSESAPPPADPNVPAARAPAAEPAETAPSEGAGESEYVRNEDGTFTFKKLPGEPAYVPRRLARYTQMAREAERQRDATAAQLQTEREQRIRYETELAVLRNAGRQPQPPGDQPQQEAPRPQAAPIDAEAIRRQAIEDSTARVRTEAAERARVAQFNEASNRTALAIREAHGDAGLQAAAKGWQEAGLDFAKPQHMQLVGLLNSLPDGADLYHKIGTNPDLAEHIANLDPVRAAYEIRGLSSSANGSASPAVQAAASRGTPAVSSAPRPPSQPATPRGASSAPVNIYDPKITPEAYARARGHKR